MFDGTPCFKPAGDVAVKLQAEPEPLHRGAAIQRMEGSYQVLPMPVKGSMEVLGTACQNSPSRNVPIKKISKPLPSSPPPSRICEDDERRIMLKMEHLLKNEARIVEVEEENRVLTRIVMRLQAENDALKAK